VIRVAGTIAGRFEVGQVPSLHVRCLLLCDAATMPDAGLRRRAPRNDVPARCRPGATSWDAPVRLHAPDATYVGRDSTIRRRHMTTRADDETGERNDEEHEQDEQRHKERLAREQGKAYAASYKMLMAEDPHAETDIDDYRITASFEPAEGMYVPTGDGLTWKTPAKSDNQHFEVIVRDRTDGRFIPGLDVHMRLLDASDEAVAETDIPFIWHPFVLHYGVDARIPKEGDYTAEVTIPAPRFHRHDELRGKRYERDVTVRLGPIHLTPGRKPHGPE
jgi:Fe2+ transport protein